MWPSNCTMQRLKELRLYIAANDTRAARQLEGLRRERELQPPGLETLRLEELQLELVLL